MMGIAAPLFAPESAVIGSISLVIPARDASAQIVELATRRISDAGAEISVSLQT
jgi:DNA-binding IclR family transcriptional regulator